MLICFFLSPFVRSLVQSHAAVGCLQEILAAAGVREMSYALRCEGACACACACACTCACVVTVINHIAVIFRTMAPLECACACMYLKGKHMSRTNEANTGPLVSKWRLKAHAHFLPAIGQHHRGIEATLGLCHVTERSSYRVRDESVSRDTIKNHFGIQKSNNITMHPHRSTR